MDCNEKLRLQEVSKLLAHGITNVIRSNKAAPADARFVRDV